MIYHILLAFVVTFIITVVLGKIAIPMLRSLHNKVFVKKVQKVIKRKRVRQQWGVLS